MYHFILNPASRSGISEKIWISTIEPYLTLHKIDYQVHFSKSKGNITSIVKDIQIKEASICRIVVLGGDGTLNEALQGITDFSRVHLGLIPVGSGNDFTRDMSIPRNALKALEKIVATKEPTPMDYGTVTYEDGSTERFIVSCGIGFDAAVCEEANRSRLKGFLNKLGLGKLVYLGIALKQLFGAKPISATLTSDGEPPIHLQKILFLASMNHKFEGGGFMFAPDADFADGLLNMCEVSDIPKLKILFALPTAFKGKHYRFKGIRGFKSASFTLETSAPMWVHTDGEVSRKSSRISIECHRNTLFFLS